jgi:hypothetical protein
MNFPDRHVSEEGRVTRRGSALLLALSGVLGALTPACNSPRRDALVAEPAVPAPDTLLAEVTLRDPDDFWSRLRAAGGPLMTMPATAGQAIASLTHVESRLGNLVDGAAPFYAAIGEGSQGTAFAVAMRLRDPVGAPTVLFEGTPARYTRQAADGMTVLVAPDGVGTSSVVALSPSGFLVIASSKAELATLGAYAARTLPAGAPASASVEVRAAKPALARAGTLATGLTGRLVAMLSGAARALTPAGVDSAALVTCLGPATRNQVALLGDLADATLDIDTGASEVHGTVTLTPRPGENPARARFAAMHPGDAAPLLDVPRDATNAWFVSDTSAERMEDLSTTVPCVERALGPLLDDTGRAALEAALGAWGKGRGDWEVGALVGDGRANGLVLRAPVTDADAATHALSGLADVVRRSPFGDGVQQLFGVKGGELQDMDAGLLGHATVLTFASAGRGPRAAAMGGPTAPPIGLAWTVGTEIDFGAGQSPGDLLTLARANPTLGSEPSSAKAVRALGTNATFAAVLRPFDCCSTGGAGSVPIVFGWGRQGDAGWSRIEVGYGLLANLAARISAR